MYSSDTILHFKGLTNTDATAALDLTMWDTVVLPAQSHVRQMSCINTQQAIQWVHQRLQHKNTTLYTADIDKTMGDFTFWISLLLSLFAQFKD